ncbi:MAG: recombination protein RecR [Chloroflexi bacterium]|nr:MAG: recombination protein RecR [Chloroflexota bacterium]
MNDPARPTGASAVTAIPLARLIEAFHRLPGIGPKSAQRLAYHVLRAPQSEAQELADALLDVKQRIRLCGLCQNLTETDPCGVCLDPARDPSIVCVVEEPLDVLAVERAAAFRGRYHVLHGHLSPMDGIGPEQIKVQELLARLGAPSPSDTAAASALIEEVILATNPNLEGEATAAYLARLLVPLGVRVSRIAHGLPIGSDVEYADERTLHQAMEHRVPLGDADGNRISVSAPPAAAAEESDRSAQPTP